MSNGSNVNVDFSGTIGNIADSVGKLFQFQIDTLNSGIKTVSQFVEPLAKTTTDLATNLAGTLNNVLQSISSAFAPKK
ncbi:chlorosome envelope protein B [Chlorobium sp. BLA1]|uniref:chlorosome envelope protein B n=1 Tax=Candidatus Chlorobium masyuteum TaxID=2716876 RepID=UPI00141F8432|nr:chlorosome envelope protein B [Candidatus Chlorobium masyuteum]NHQ60449.1 chlorosome envelope protein B [Candidatus Chlorobium masyuteum]NTU43973.1 chlorosome envelope protein B [Chlorobiaceae bacterium]